MLTKRDTSARGVRARLEGGIAREISRRGLTVVVKRTGAGRHARGLVLRDGGNGW